MGFSLDRLLRRGEGEEEREGGGEEGSMSSDTWERRRKREGKILFSGMIECECVMTGMRVVMRYE